MCILRIWFGYSTKIHSFSGMQTFSTFTLWFTRYWQAEGAPCSVNAIYSPENLVLAFSVNHVLGKNQRDTFFYPIAAKVFKILSGFGISRMKSLVERSKLYLLFCYFRIFHGTWPLFNYSYLTLKQSDGVNAERTLDAIVILGLVISREKKTDQLENM